MESNTQEPSSAQPAALQAANGTMATTQDEVKSPDADDPSTPSLSGTGCSPPIRPNSPKRLKKNPGPSTSMAQEAPQSDPEEIGLHAELWSMQQQLEALKRGVSTPRTTLRVDEGSAEDRRIDRLVEEMERFHRLFGEEDNARPNDEDLARLSRALEP